LKTEEENWVTLGWILGTYIFFNSFLLAIRITQIL
jgi:hypothetical protein